jgi:hypothetical protein
MRDIVYQGTIDVESIKMAPRLSSMIQETP